MQPSCRHRSGTCRPLATEVRIAARQKPEKETVFFLRIGDGNSSGSSSGNTILSSVEGQSIND
ncbi:hypothetical protein DRM94_06540 [Aeromonas taiwanensis]|uniref:Uncharacterized protein n=1 Tax=Aeromonas taiwanensis TaxID=633417 RepID=A0A5F0KDF6_9GAMM|nr:hypothetical protein DRM93_06540 [Aeromonas taiwanensis]TFF78628.1 hypothetical protein DRM95_07270 [Aeromonas taiwanensis]TFF82384.1 hypothetical protein DRM94_06540 [Aeromonas taiwanensis]